MSSRILRNIVAGPRAPHPEANLDLCYVTDNIIATSGPSATYPSLAYRNPLDALVKYLDTKHGDQWCIWEFRAEGTGYPDEAVHGRIWHFPWPDHHPPPFALVPRIMAGMRDWVRGQDGMFEQRLEERISKDSQAAAGKDGGEAGDHRVIVVHCKAGKGRSGSMAISYLMSEEGWQRGDALKRFTERRMRPGFGSGISIPSQLRWLKYVERWRDHGKIYVEQQAQVMEVHIWGLRDGVKLAIEGYAEEGRKIQTVHTFTRQERDDVDNLDSGKEEVNNNGFASAVSELLRQRKILKAKKSSAANSALGTPARTPKSSSQTNLPQTASDDLLASSSTLPVNPATKEAEQPSSSSNTGSGGGEDHGKNVIFKPKSPILLPTNEINLSVERRSRATYGLTLITSVAHVWINCFFEGNGPESVDGGNVGPASSGVFNITWDEMDGIKGSSKKGTRAFDRCAIVWRVPLPSERAGAQGHAAEQAGVLIEEPAPGVPVEDTSPADWRGKDAVHQETVSPSGRANEIAHDIDLRRDDGEEDNSDEEGVNGIRRGLRLPEGVSGADEKAK